MTGIIKPDYNAIEERVREQGETFASFLRKAGVPYDTWFRWKTGANSPNLGKLNQVLQAVDDLEKK